MTLRHCVAVDLGASNGRVMLARYDSADNKLTLREIHRFINSLKRVDDHDIWDVDALEREIRFGLQKACDEGVALDSIGIDTWGVDYVLIDKQGNRVGLPISYRDNRTDGIMARAQQELGCDEIYRRSGIQFLPFNTLYQLRALVEQQPALLDKVAHALLMPDYLYYRLTGALNWEYTNATTTQLVNINTDDWDDRLLDWAGVPPGWFGSPTHPGRILGQWRCQAGRPIAVISVATHDTASAVIAAPLADQDAAYLVSGTWSLMGFESKTPYTSEKALAANITNEGGAEGRYRVLKNIMGLWLLQRIAKEMAVSDLPDLIRRARHLPACRFVINPNDARFINPPSMSREIQAACRESRQPVPTTDSDVARCIFDSLALLYAEALSELAELRGRPFTGLHIVGGGSQNHFLNQLCADACGIPVSVGPVEASTLGNIGCQLMALNDIADVDAFRTLVAQNSELTHFQPDPESDIARFVARRHQNRQTRKELCA
ncbi:MULTISPECIES: rhamnulokinase [unclassified Brenneria]|uniref:rhamnulokinase n=1 Tax=unclassified Brenneria TaxID=2634434 RepID=UPI001553A0CC|nr:rhamnulokinase [Brenneria sp. hezel4-2-4]MEE3650096.1 rhamnulokinase [Brenneria sp. HEZEL_4_2_4]NPD00055.1 rhamnulokinase [Brenneria sp. hezel4-2-4]